ncbi:Potassium/sodium hyperpolarization-activated cyclic nucleotide-gated channel 4 [Phytophthora nicotianae]|uniref:Potassium/sodium hyperpolarization-activated cyclic nucleotide-gated channel 4 n=1 Tax=Phytophthora nicotianae TaxID=4792 RepID=A0A0W8D472_PHYNI|nr:Potassium/sodium hyperpolarization-activated cyclic nucleotide-gated channel 4 [Phytophthora nicotianae]
MPLSPTKLRGPMVTTSLEQEDVEQFRSISVSDIDDSNDIEVISATEAEEEMPRDPRREEEQPMTKEKRLAFKQLERWRAAMKKKSKRLGRRSVRWNAKTQAYDDEEVEFDNLFGTNSTFGQEVESEKTNSYFNLLTLFLTAASLAIYILGFALIANGRVETFYMNKESSRLCVRSNKPLCLSKRYIRSVERDMRHITNIRVETAGEYSGDVDTRTYKVHFDFDDGSHVSALESRSKQKTMRRCRHIKAFVAAASAPVAPIRSASEHFPSTAKGSGSPLRQNRTSPAKLSLE